MNFSFLLGVPNITSSTKLHGSFFPKTNPWKGKNFKENHVSHHREQRRLETWHTRISGVELPYTVHRIKFGPGHF
jgi:hypothetical protein